MSPILPTEFPRRIQIVFTVEDANDEIAKAIISNWSDSLRKEDISSIEELIEMASFSVQRILYGTEQPPPSKILLLEVCLRTTLPNGVAHARDKDVPKGEKIIELCHHYFKKQSFYELKGVLWHEMVHIWQHNSNGSMDGGLVEGIADYVRLSANLAPLHWPKPEDAGRQPKDVWNRGYEVTAYFLMYIEEMVQKQLVREINWIAKDRPWIDDIFKEITKYTVTELWDLYQRR